MNDNTVNASGPSSYNSPEMSKPVGPVIGLVIILAIILMGGVYFWISRTSDVVPTDYSAPVQQKATNSPQAIKSQSSSDDASSIQADLNAYGKSDINGVSSGL